MSECYWIEDMQPDGWVVWQTTCANMFEFTADGPDENNFKFCPYCGGKLRHTGRQAGNKPRNKPSVGLET